MFGRSASGSNVKVRFNDSDLVGTAEEVGCVHCVRISCAYIYTYVCVCVSILLFLLCFEMESHLENTKSAL